MSMQGNASHSAASGSDVSQRTAHGSDASPSSVLRPPLQKLIDDLKQFLEQFGRWPSRGKTANAEEQKLAKRLTDYKSSIPQQKMDELGFLINVPQLAPVRESSVSLSATVEKLLVDVKHFVEQHGRLPKELKKPSCEEERMESNLSLIHI